MSSNAFMLFALARTVDDGTFGRYSLVYGASILAIGVTRASTVDLISARFGGDRDRVQAAVEGNIQNAMRYALVLAIFVAVVALGVQAGTGGLLLAFSVLPIAIHEFMRQGSIASYQPILALLADLLWIVVALVVWVGLRAFEIDAGSTIIISWLAGATAAAGSGLLRVHKIRQAPIVDGVNLERQSMRQYSFEFAISRGTPEVVAWSLAIFGTVAQAGHFRLAQVLLGPLSVVIGGARALLVAELRPAKSRLQHLARLARRASLGLGLLPLMFLIAILLMPDRFVDILLADIDRTVITFAALLAARRAFGAASIPPFLVLRILQRDRLTSSLRLVEAVVAAVLISAVGFAFGANGSLVGYVLATVIGFVGWWSVATHALNQEGRQAHSG